MPNPINVEVQKLEVDAMIELFTLDVSPLGGSVFRFHNMQAKDPAGTNISLTGDITFNSQTYAARPIKVEGIEYTGQGQKPRPRIRIANLEALVSGLVLDYDDLIGAIVTRTRTLRKFLDGQPGADPTAIFPTDTFYITQKEVEDHTVIVFSMADPTELQGVTLPNRKFIASACREQYRGEVCQYAGDPIYELDGTPITGPFNDCGTWNPAASYNAGDKVTQLAPDGVPHVFVARSFNVNVPVTNNTYWKADRCSKTLARCKLTFGAAASLPYGGYPAINQLPS